MAKKRSGSLVPGKRRVRNVKHLPDSKIDFSDIPELTKEQLARARRVAPSDVHGAKEMIAIGVSQNLFYKLQKLAKKKHKPYQTLLHELLEDAVKRAA